MGCGSSKSNKKDKKDKKEGKHAGIGDARTVTDKKKGAVTRKRSKRSNRGNVSLSGSQSKISTGLCGPDGDQLRREFEQVVCKALQEDLEFATVFDLEGYISQNTRLSIDPYNRRKIIQKVVVEQFLDGCIAVRTLKGNCF